MAKRKPNSSPLDGKTAALDQEVQRLRDSIARTQQRITTLRSTQDRARRKRQEVLHNYIEDLLPAMNGQAYRSLLETLPTFMNEPGNDELFDSVKPTWRNKLLGAVFVLQDPKHLVSARTKLAAWLDKTSYKNLSLPSCDPALNAATIQRLATLVTKMTVALADLESTVKRAKDGKINLAKVPEQSLSTLTTTSTDSDDNMLLYLLLLSNLNSEVSGPAYAAAPEAFVPGGGTFDGGGASGGWDQQPQASASTLVDQASAAGVLGALS